jgi:hypothetical protein
MVKTAVSVYPRLCRIKQEKRLHISAATQTISIAASIQALNTCYQEDKDISTNQQRD